MAKALCKYSRHDIKLGKIDALISDAQFYCGSCARSANHKKALCRPIRMAHSASERSASGRSASETATTPLQLSTQPLTKKAHNVADVIAKAKAQKQQRDYLQQARIEPRANGVNVVIPSAMVEKPSTTPLLEDAPAFNGAEVLNGIEVLSNIEALSASPFLDMPVLSSIKLDMKRLKASLKSQKKQHKQLKKLLKKQRKLAKKHKKMLKQERKLTQQQTKISQREAQVEQQLLQLAEVNALSLVKGGNVKGGSVKAINKKADRQFADNALVGKALTINSLH